MQTSGIGLAPHAWKWWRAENRRRYQLGYWPRCFLKLSGSRNSVYRGNVREFVWLNKKRLLRSFNCYQNPIDFSFNMCKSFGFWFRLTALIVFKINCLNQRILWLFRFSGLVFLDLGSGRTGLQRLKTWTIFIYICSLACKSYCLNQTEKIFDWFEENARKKNVIKKQEASSI